MKTEARWLAFQRRANVLTQLLKYEELDALAKAFPDTWGLILHMAMCEPIEDKGE